MDKRDDHAHPDQAILLAALDIGSKEIARGKFSDIEDLFFELDEMDTLQVNTWDKP